MTDPILAATTTAELMAAVDKVYDLDLPISMPDGTVLGQLWAAGISVSKGAEPGIAYQARGTGTVPLPPTAATLYFQVREPQQTTVTP
jgi:hypothetical protein